MTAGLEDKRSIGQIGRESVLSITYTSLLLCFYSKHLECSVAIYNVIQGVLFVETAELHERNFWNITDRKIILEMSQIAREIN